MRKKTIIFLSIIILISALILITKVINKKPSNVEEEIQVSFQEQMNNDIDVSEKKEDKTNTNVVYRKVNITSQTELNNENCEYTIDNSSSKITLKKYEENEEYVNIPKEINGNQIEKIEKGAFSDCYNLEKIQIAKELEGICGNIKDFEINKETQNDEYIEYVTTREYSDAYQGYLSLSEEEKANQEMIPEKFEVPVEKLYSAEIQNYYSNLEVADEQIPGTYDLRDYIDIRVESQGSHGTCYAYASLNAVETNLALINNEIVDLSEIHVGMLTSGYGGNFISQSSSYATSKIGPVYEEDWAMNDIYGNTTNYIYKIINNYLSDNTDSIQAEELEAVKNMLKETKAVKYITKTVNMPSVSITLKKDEGRKDELNEIRNTIKKHIMTYGSLYSSLYMGNDIEYKGNTVMNCQEATKSGHAISIIGWDDNFSKENFPVEMRPKENGAYLALNSWGTDYGNNGCFWISYEDRFVESGLKGVVSVEEIKENIKSERMEIKDTDYNVGVKNNNIKRGTKIQIKIDLKIKNLIQSVKNIQVKLRDSKNDYTDKLLSTVEDTKNNTARVTLDINTSTFEQGTYIIEIKYGEEVLSKQIDIVPNTFEYKINEDGKSITITSYNGNDKKIEIPKEYLGFNVTGIGASAFYNTNIESIIIHENIKEIGSSIVKKGVIIYGEENTAIEEYANKNKYEFIKLGTNKLEGDYWYFEVEENTLYITKKMETYKNYSSTPWYNFNKNIYKINISDDVNEIKNYAFYGCSNLKEVKMSTNITNIQTQAFYNCTSLKKIELPNCLTVLGNYAFGGCTNLIEIKIPENLTTINENAFNGCTSLEKIELPEKITSIGKSAFYGCTNLKEIKISKNITNINEGTFYNCISLEKIEIPEKVTTIGTNAFNSCTNLKEIKIPNGVTKINDSAFYNCTSLSKIEVADSVTSIGKRVFAKCINLTNIKLPKNIIELGDEIFLDSVLNISVKFGVDETEKQLDNPNILNRILDKADVLYSSEKLLATSCEMKNETGKIIINANSAFSNSPTIKILEGKMIGFTIKINAEFENLSKIEIKKQPDKTTYIEGENFDKKGMVVEAVYENGERRDVTNYTILSGNRLKIGTTEITISYTEREKTRTTTQAIIVNEKPKTIDLVGITIKVMPNKIVYNEGEDFNAEGMIVIAQYKDGTEKEVTNYLINEGTNLKVGQTSVTIAYTDKITVEVTQEITVNGNGEENKGENKGEENKGEENKGEQQEQTQTQETLPNILMKSGNNYLKDLSTNLEGVDLIFNKHIREYKINVGEEVEKIEFKALKEDSRAKVEIIKNNKLTYGKNFISILVEAENGLKRSYVVEVTREGGNTAPEIDNSQLIELLEQVSTDDVKPKEKVNIFIPITIVTVMIAGTIGVIVLAKKRVK